MAIVGYANATYRWRTGFVNAAQLTATYNLTAFPRFTDMGAGKWFNPEGAPLFNEGAVAESTLGGDANFLGLRTVEWALAGLTSEMLNYVLNSAALFNGAASMDSTISTWNGGKNQWEFVWAKTRRGIISEAGQPGFGRGLRSLTIAHLVLQDAP